VFSRDLGIEILELEKSPKMLRKSRSVPTDLDELMNSNKPTTRTRTSNSEQLPDKGESPRKDSLNSNTDSINSNTDMRRSSLPKHLDCGGGNRRPKSAVIVSGDEGQFVYLDSPSSNSPVLRASPLTSTNQKAASGHVTAETDSGSEVEASNAQIVSCDLDNKMEKRRSKSLDELAPPTKQPHTKGTYTVYIYCKIIISFPYIIIYIGIKT